MSTKRKTHSAKFKAKVALDALKGDRTAAELISAHKVSSGQISTWKKCLVKSATQLFESGYAKKIDETTLTAPLYEEIGRLKVELDWLKKSVEKHDYGKKVVGGSRSYRHQPSSTV